LRYQKFDRSISDTSIKTADFGVNYIVNGPKVKISAMYSKIDDNRIVPASAQDTNRFTLGVQLMY
jgi:hypothetical protein